MPNVSLSMRHVRASAHNSIISGFSGEKGGGRLSAWCPLWTPCTVPPRHRQQLCNQAASILICHSPLIRGNAGDSDNSHCVLRSEQFIFKGVPGQALTTGPASRLGSHYFPEDATWWHGNCIFMTVTSWIFFSGAILTVTSPFLAFIFQVLVFFTVRSCIG